MKLLVFCPTYRLEPETVEAIFALEHSEPVTVLFSRDNPYRGDDYGKANILYNYRKMRQIVIDQQYDAVLVIESDVIPPPDTLTRLAAVDADIVYGLYLFRRGDPYPVNVLRYVDAPHPDQSLSLYPDDYRNAWGEVIPCSGSGLGCVLIYRKVLEQIDFRDGPVHCDTQFTEDVYRAGFCMMADMSVVCGHKLPSGRICWPTKTNEPHWTDGNIKDFRGMADDPTEKLEQDIKAGKPPIAGTRRIRLLQDFAGPTVFWAAGSIQDWSPEAAQRAVDNQLAEWAEDPTRETAPAPKQAKRK